MSKTTLQLNIISAERSLFSGNVSSVVFPGVSGSFGVYPEHAPLISPLKEGDIVYTIDNKEHRQPVSRGVVEVVNGEITACVEC
ncbi:MAG: hypothetical protein LBS16_03440 [Prevotellaceae bacterium]|jgi:F-type H+-transporting ATPase subunit epsilon|nr:hypothetical protein [Prevotellaceae bacterium]